MSLAAPELEARDPFAVLTDGERRSAEQIVRESSTAHTLAEAALALGAGYLLYRAYMARRIRAGLTPAVTRSVLASIVDFHGKQFLPVWVRLTSGALAAAAARGVDTKHGEIPDELLFALGDDYAERLGVYMHESSKEALLEGFTAYVNKRVPPKLAAEKAVTGYGLNRRQIRGLVALKPQGPVNSVVELDPEKINRRYVESAILDRARGLGNQEAYAISQEGRQLGWMYQLKEGRLSKETKRMWVTAKDERTCRVCAPMHRKTAKIDEPFVTSQGRVWTPSLHPNCRCEMKLKVPATRNLFALAKSRDGDGDGYILDGTRLERLVATKTEETTRAPGRVGGRIDRVGGRVDGRVGGRVAQRIEAPQAIAARTESRVEIPRAEASRLVQAVLDTRAAPARVEPKVAEPQPRTRTETKTTTKTVFSTITPLKEDMYLVETGPMNRDATTMRLSGEEFVNFDRRNEELEKHFESALDYNTKAILREGRNVVQVSESGERFSFTGEDVRDMLEAELYGEDSPMAQHAREMGFRREDHALDVYVVRLINTDESDGEASAFEARTSVEVGGDYEIEDSGAISGRHTLPIRYVWLNPKQTRPDEELD